MQAFQVIKRQQCICFPVTPLPFTPLNNGAYSPLSSLNLLAQRFVEEIPRMQLLLLYNSLGIKCCQQVFRQGYTDATLITKQSAS